MVDGRQASMKSLPDAGHQAQRHELASALVHVLRQLLLQVRLAILKRVGHLRAEQHGQPRQIKPAHEQRHEGEAAVNLAGVHHAET